ncbi:MAG: TSUP family transporter [Candidatus Palauibacterales bacterium]|nr:TSUP family transporter [Candidatus Palauibacterales bacterium]
MDNLSYLVIGLVTFAASLLTLFSGFGLGSLLVGTFVFFFPVEVAISATAVVHLVHNLLKGGIFYRRAVPRVVLSFGIPAVIAAFAGALALAVLSEGTPLATWQAGRRVAEITPLKLVMGILIAGFALIDLTPGRKAFRMGERWLPLGGALSGFFGGLSGHQGAFRAAFLSQLDFEPEAYVGTQAVLAVMVDLARLIVYGAALYSGHMAIVSGRFQWTAVGIATAAAAAGVLVGWRFLHKTTFASLRVLIGVLLLAVGLGLMAGLL